jgi:tRNA/tmRNA/rRNA uracil-C5-methylase (TrmA/RlmC/RlmD family)
MQETFINIKSLDMDARGVGHLENEDGSPGKVIFVEGALPGERVSFETLRKKKNWEAGRMVTLQKASRCASSRSARTSALRRLLDAAPGAVGPGRDEAARARR